MVCGEAVEVMRSMAAESVNSIVCDPPYGLEFMGKEWDKLCHEGDTKNSVPKKDLGGSGFEGFVRTAKPRYGRDGKAIQAWHYAWAVEAIRVLKPGGHLLAFGGSRTYHRLACAIEDAGFEIRDQIPWLYGTGFPKSLDVSKAIDKAAGARREEIGTRNPCPERGAWSAHGSQAGYRGYAEEHCEGGRTITAPATGDAATWAGWGTALKPAHEPICLARKPLSEKTVAASVLRHGTGALNIDACRVEVDRDDAQAMSRCNTPGSGRFHAIRMCEGAMGRSSAGKPFDTTQGRWPANVIHDGSDEVLAGFPVLKGMGLTGARGGGAANTGDPIVYSGGWEPKSRWDSLIDNKGDSAARFFYCAKASRGERWFYCWDCGKAYPEADRKAHKHGHDDWKHIVVHPTVKPLKLMKYLVRLVTPPGGLVLDPFAGTGTTACACLAQGFPCIGIEKNAEYAAIARARIAAAQGPLFKRGGKAACS